MFIMAVLAFTVVSPQMGTEGWPFASVDPFPGADVDPLYQSQHVKDLYLRADPNYTGRFTVPVLWDKKQHTIVNNESSEIIRLLNSEFNAILPEERANLDFYPGELRKDIDEVNEWVYDRINSAFWFDGDASSRKVTSHQMAFTSLASQQHPRHIVPPLYLSSRLLTVLRLY
jgi:putative glutathione S-transferase